MAALDEMRVKIGMDLSELTKGTAVAENELAGVGKAALKTQTALNGLSSSNTNVSKSLAAAGMAAAQLDSKLQTTSSAVARSGTNFTGLSRVLQDLPFGFVAISNNLEQLLPAAGAAGLALSAIVSIATFASVGFGAWTRSLGSNKDALEAQKEAAKKAKEETEAFKDGLENAKSAALSTGLSLRAFVDIARDGNRPLAERNEALREANKIMGEHGEKLTLVNINTKAVTETVNKFTEALVQQAVAAKYADRIADLTMKQTQNAKEYNKEIQKLNQYYEYNRKLAKDAGGAANVSIFDYADVAKQAGIARTALNAYNATTGEIKTTTGDFNNSINQSVKLFGDLGTKTKETHKDTKTYSDVIADLNKELRGLNGELDGNFIDEDQFDKGLVAAYQKAVKSLSEIKGTPQGKIEELQIQIQPVIEAQEFQKRLAENIKEKVGTVSQTDLYKASDEIPVVVNLKPTLNTDRALQAIDDKLREDFKQIALNVQKEVMNSGLASIGDTIGAAIAGGNVGDAFHGLLDVVINGMRQLGEAMIGLGTAKTALEKFNIAPGIGTVIAGIGVIALSSVLKSALPKFAEGVTGFGGGYALVGERGPEVVRLPQGSDVIPNHRMGQVTGSGPEIVLVNSVIKGTDLHLVLDRAGRQLNRRG